MNPPVPLVSCGRDDPLAIQVDGDPLCHTGCSWLHLIGLESPLTSHTSASSMESFKLTRQLSYDTWEYLHKYPISFLPLDDYGTSLDLYKAGPWVMCATRLGIHRGTLWELLDELHICLKLVC